MTESVSLLRADEKLTAFRELESGDSPLTREGGAHIAQIELQSKFQVKEKYYVRRHSPLPL
jgi:hypothetical protein